jgi:hypothetical protein
MTIILISQGFQGVNFRRKPYIYGCSRFFAGPTFYLLIVINFIDHQASINRKVIKLMSLISLCFLVNEYFYAQTPLIALNHKNLNFLHYFNTLAFLMLGFQIMYFAVKNTRAPRHFYTNMQPSTL